MHEIGIRHSDLDYFVKKNLVMFDELYNTFLNRMPNVLSGYTKENKEKAKELYQK